MSKKKLYTYNWGNNDKRKALKGRICEIVTSGKKNTILIKFLDNGMMELVSRRALRRIKDK